MSLTLKLAVGAILTLIAATSHANNDCKLAGPAATAAVVFDKMDRFSPYALGNYESTNSIVKIKGYSFDSLAIIFRSQLLAELNFELQNCGLSKISQNHLQFLTQAGDYLSIVMAKVEQQKEVTLIHQSTAAQSQKTGIKAETVTLLLD